VQNLIILDVIRLATLTPETLLSPATDSYQHGICQCHFDIENG